MKESWKAINELLNKRSRSSSIDCFKESGTNNNRLNNTDSCIHQFQLNCFVYGPIRFTLSKRIV